MLSVCLIARNEESNLPRVLKSVRDVADEIVVADTGSTDRTAEIAKESGAVVCQFPWCDDFSAARNFAIRHAQGDWIFWLDADEELLPESIGELRASVARDDALAYHVRRQDLTDAARPDHFTTMWQLRLFRRREDMRFLGRCHPHFEPGEWEIADKLGLQVCESSITIRHYGYIGALRPAKLRRAARLLELELRERPGQPYYQVELGRTLMILGEERRGHEILCQTLAAVLPQVTQSDDADPIMGLLLEYFLSLSAEHLPAGVTGRALEDLARQKYSNFAPIAWLLARRTAEAGQFEESEQWLRRLVRMGREQNYDQHVSFNPRLVGCDAKLNLGVCLARGGKVDEARQLFKELLTDPDRGKEAREYLNLIEPLGSTSYSFS